MFLHGIRTKLWWRFFIHDVTSSAITYIRTSASISESYPNESFLGVVPLLSDSVWYYSVWILIFYVLWQVNGALLKLISVSCPCFLIFHLMFPRASVRNHWTVPLIQAILSSRPPLCHHIVETTIFIRARITEHNPAAIHSFLISFILMALCTEWTVVPTLDLNCLLLGIIRLTLNLSLTNKVWSFASQDTQHPTCYVLWLLR